jgi:hypothetical protein
VLVRYNRGSLPLYDVDGDPIAVRTKLERLKKPCVPRLAGDRHFQPFLARQFMTSSSWVTAIRTFSTACRPSDGRHPCRSTGQP